KLVSFGMHEEDLTTVIENRQINEQGKCRKLNTCIKSKENERDYKANGFDVIDCVRNEQGGKCKYTGIPENGFQITLTCKKGKPVYYICLVSNNTRFLNIDRRVHELQTFLFDK
uniref:Uncharacterized protein n=1 Tax=Sinocyclocheilus anshuiensis TaxID=1608454 RepID=A0A671PT35_9TELE